MKSRVLQCGSVSRIFDRRFSAERTIEKDVAFGFYAKIAQNALGESLDVKAQSELGEYRRVQTEIGVEATQREPGCSSSDRLIRSCLSPSGGPRSPKAPD